MPIIDIQGKKVHVEEGHSVQHAVDFLNKNPNDAKAFFEASHHDHVNGLSHFETNKPAGYTGSTNFTLIHKGDGTYDLRKKEHHIF